MMEIESSDMSLDGSMDLMRIGRYGWIVYDL